MIKDFLGWANFLEGIQIRELEMRELEMPNGNGHRNGAVKGRSQTYYPESEIWPKRNAYTGKFMAEKKDGTPFNIEFTYDISEEEKLVLKNAIKSKS